MRVVVVCVVLVSVVVLLEPVVVEVSVAVELAVTVELVDPEVVDVMDELVERELVVDELVDLEVVEEIDVNVASAKQAIACTPSHPKQGHTKARASAKTALSLNPSPTFAHLFEVV